MGGDNKTGDRQPLDWDDLFCRAGFGMALLTLPDYRLLKANSAFEQLCGRPFEEMSGQSILRRLVHLPDNIPLSFLIGEVLPVTMEGAAARWVRISVTENEDTALAVIEDVSDQKALEAQMIHADRLAHLGGLTTTLQHDFSQPLNIIRLTTENTLDRLEEGGSFDEAGHNRLLRSLHVVMQQLRRTQELFDITWGYSHPPENPPLLCDIRAAVEDAVERVRQRPCSAKIRIEILKPSHPICMFVHEKRLSEIVFQLILNSCEAISSDSANQGVDYKSGFVEIGFHVEQTQEIVTISIVDNGPGLKPGIARRLKRPDFSSHPTGKGLGLLVAFGIASELGGFIEVPEIGVGTRFDIVLPLEPNDAETTPPNEEETE